MRARLRLLQIIWFMYVCEWEGVQAENGVCFVDVPSEDNTILVGSIATERSCFVSEANVSRGNSEETQRKNKVERLTSGGKGRGKL